MPAAARASRRRVAAVVGLLAREDRGARHGREGHLGVDLEDGHRRPGAQPGVDLDDLVAQGEGLRTDALSDEAAVDGVGLETRGCGVGGAGQRREDRRRLAGECSPGEDVGLADRVVGQTDRDVDADDTDAGRLAHHGDELGDRRRDDDARPGCPGLEQRTDPAGRAAVDAEHRRDDARPVRACRPPRRRRTVARGGPRGGAAPRRSRPPRSSPRHRRRSRARPTAPRPAHGSVAAASWSMTPPNPIRRGEVEGSDAREQPSGGTGPRHDGTMHPSTVSGVGRSVKQ